MDKQQTQEFIARRVAMELQDGNLVNLGIGMPTLVANFVPEGGMYCSSRKMASSVWDLPRRKIRLTPASPMPALCQ